MTCLEKDQAPQTVVYVVMRTMPDGSYGCVGVYADRETAVCVYKAHKDNCFSERYLNKTYDLKLEDDSIAVQTKEQPRDNYKCYYSREDRCHSPNANVRNCYGLRSNCRYFCTPEEADE